ncbi:MAG: CopG family ribbon-helix-helix protein, partial [Nitrosotalea sp.]
KKTSTITFRLDENTLQRLHHESNSKQVSTNTLVNQALKQFLDWGIYESTIGFVIINKQVFVHVFGKLSQSEIIDVATRVGKDEVKNIALFMKGAIDIQSFLSWFETRMTNSSVQVSHIHEDDGFHRYVMKHELGKNWSLYHKTILELIFEEIFDKKINVKIDKTMISFEFSDP